MKTIHRTALLLTALLAAFACQEKPVDPVDPTPAAPQPESRTLTFVLPAVPAGEGEVPAALKTAWKAGDQIVVHGEYAKDQVTVTLAAGDISGDGKTATVTVDGLYPYRRDDCASTLYASYPASVADNLKHCFFYSKFSTTNAQLMAASNDGDTFRFQNICGILSMSVEGDFGGYTISTPKKEALGYEFLQVKLTDNEQNYRQYVGNPVLQLDGTVNGSDILVFVPEGTSFESGFVIKFKEGDDYTRIFKYTEPLEIARGELVDLGDITADVQHYDNPFSSDIIDLDEKGNANCYVVTAPGGYKFKAVYGNEPTNYLKDVDAAEVLWETWNDVSEVTPGSVVASASFAEDYIILHTPATLHPGNAVIAAKDASGKILWSWHIWVPATEIVTAGFGGIMGNDLMDRNLGALVAAEATDATVDVRSYGLMYQWGRKDPFTGSGVAMQNTVATVAGAQDEVAPAQITLEESIANPRLLGHMNNGDWLLVPDNTAWDDIDKTLYDPCPAGYRVPPMNTAVPFWNGISTQAGWSVNLTAGWLTVGVPATVLPIAGYRDDYSVGGMSKVGLRTLIWTAKNSTDAAGSGNDLRPDGGTFSLKGAPKARLGSVRCVKE
ncbi:MAG: hypothetical protein IJ156_06565 [Bacteroidales bacterium]|nr:hypothetical protein [Bacteroidales bacterium]